MNAAQPPAPDVPRIVALGASAGGLAAFEAFFLGLPAEAPATIAWVLLQHLSPDHPSLLPELVRRFTALEVVEITDGLRPRPACVHVAPPGQELTLVEGLLRLTAPTEERGHRLPIDALFGSLARELRERASVIVLSGTGHDGAAGVRAVHEAGGLVLVQAPASTTFDGMPRAAIDGGPVDAVLPPEQLAGRLLTLLEQGARPAPIPALLSTPANEGAWARLFVLLQARSGHDFSRYKPNTLHRRIERRMALHALEPLAAYVALLERDGEELDALFRELLIGVTHFFRDPEVFTALGERVLPALFSSRPQGAPIRGWCAGCSTGEEAYSLAILLQEQLDASRARNPVQLFATDLDDAAIATARAALYPRAIAAHVSPERLARAFTVEPEGRGYRVRKSIRDLLVFSTHDVNQDPPFSRLDLISCRNLLIYLGTSLQQRLFPLFHYALRPGGVLLLGSAEGIGEFGELFEPIDRSAKIFRRREVAGRHLAPAPAYVPTPQRLELPARPPPPEPPRPPLRELTERALLQRFTPASALVDRTGALHWLHGRTGRWLEPAPGDAPASNLLRMAREGLRPALTSALLQAVERREEIRVRGLLVQPDEQRSRVDLTVLPLLSGPGVTPDAPLYLVVIEEAHGEVEEAPAPPSSADAAGGGREAALHSELHARDEQLQALQEELESSNEELRSSNEEMQSVNEELQSTNEELETSKEEMQSVNEELATVNQELVGKIQALSRANDDMNNLLAGSGIGTIFVDPKLRILRFTPAASELLHLIPTDVGRPIAHVGSNLVGYDGLVPDVQQVLDTLVVVEREVRTREGRWYAMRLQPYRTLENVVEGAVVSFVDVSRAVAGREELRQANELLRLAVVVRDSRDAITVQGLDGRTLAWNPAATRLYGWSEAEALALNVRDRIPPALRAEAAARLQQLSGAAVLEPLLTRRLHRSGEELEISLVSTALVNGGGEVYAIATTERGVSSAAPREDPKP